MGNIINKISVWEDDERKKIEYERKSKLKSDYQEYINALQNYNHARKSYINKINTTVNSSNEFQTLQNEKKLGKAATAAMLMPSMGKIPQIKNNINHARQAYNQVLQAKEKIDKLADNGNIYSLNNMPDIDSDIHALKTSNKLISSAKNNKVTPFMLSPNAPLPNLKRQTPASLNDIYGAYSSDNDYINNFAKEKYFDKVDKMSSAEIQNQINMLDKVKNDSYNNLLSRIRYGKSGAVNEAQNIKRELMTIRNIKKAEELEQNALSDKDFKLKAQYKDTDKGVFGTVFQDDLNKNYDYINNSESRASVDFANNLTNRHDASTQKYNNLGSLTDKEKEVFNYYYNTKGKEAAGVYLLAIQDRINQRVAESDFAQMKGKTSRELLSAVDAGLDNFKSGITQLVSPQAAIPTSSTQYKSAMVREDLGNDYFSHKGLKLGNQSLSQIGYDLINNTANMAPSLAASALAGSVAGPVVGALTIGAGSAGNAVQQALQEGYSPAQAWTYGALNGASEAGLQYILGGISKLGGKLTNNAVKTLTSKVNNVIGKIAIEHGGEMAGEFTEEYLQEVLDPVFRNICLDENNEIKLFSEDALYAGMLGALSSGVLEGTDSAVNSVVRNKQISSFNKSAASAARKAAGEGYSYRVFENDLKSKLSAEELEALDLKKIKRAYSEEKMNRIYDGNANPSELNSVAIDDDLRSAFEARAGVKLTGTGEEQVMQMKKCLAEYNDGKNFTNEQFKKLVSEKSTSLEFKDMSEYTPAQRGSIKEYIQSVDNRIKSAVETYRANKNAPFTRLKISDVTKREANDIKKILGYDVSGYSHAINKSAIEHIEKRHGANGLADMTMSNPNDVARIGYVLKNYDSVERVYEADGEPAYSSVLRDKNDRPAPLIRYSKKIDGTVYVVEAAAENRWNKLWVASAYANKKDVITQAPHAGKTLGTTSETTLASLTSSDTNLAQNTDGVKDSIRGDLGIDTLKSVAENDKIKSKELGNNGGEIKRTGLEEDNRGIYRGEAQRYYAGKHGEDEKTFRKVESGNDKTSGGERKIEVKGRTYSFTQTEESYVNKNASAIRGQLSKYGIASAISDTNVKISKNGNERLSRGAATTLIDGSVIINNNNPLPYKNVAAHECIHSYCRTNSAIVDNYINAVVDNINWSNNEFISYLDKINHNYFNDEMDITTDYERFFEEFSSYISGYIGDEDFNADFRQMFTNPEAVQTAWQEMMKDIQAQAGSNESAFSSPAKTLANDSDIKKAISSDNVQFAHDKGAWQADNRNDNTRKVKIKSLNNIIDEAEKAFNIPISSGKVRHKNVLGFYKTKSEAVRTVMTNDLPTICHEIGHHLDKKYNLSKMSGIEEAISNLDKGFASQYSSEELPGEAVAEFMREYMIDKLKAKQQFPTLYNEFEKSLSNSDSKIINKIADDINAYMYADLLERAKASNVSRGEKDSVTIKERLENVKEQAIINFQNEAYAIKKNFDERTWKLYSSSLDSDSIVRAAFDTYLPDINGNKVYDSLSDIVKPIKETDFDDFEVYLKLNHALEYDDQGMRTFADELMQDRTAMQNMISELDNEHPEFKNVAEMLYGYERALIQTWLVDPGLLSKEDANVMFEKFPKYVPFYRKSDIETGTRSSIANQKANIKRAKGGGQDTYSPIENILINTNKYIKAAKRNEVMRAIVEECNENQGMGYLLEKIPPDMIPKTVSINPVLKALNGIGENNEIVTGMKDYLSEVFEDGITEFTTSHFQGKDVVVLHNNGQNEYYQIHDKALFEALTSMNQIQQEAVMGALNKISRGWKTLVTGSNPFFVPNNFLRDVKAAWNNSDTNNPIKFAKDIIQAMHEIAINGETYQRYKASGGGYNTSISNPKTIVQSLSNIKDTNPAVLRKFVKKMIHPILLIENISEVVEAAPRLAEYNRVYNKTNDNIQAMYAADNITVNFKLRGKSTRVINALYPFSNAQIQGVARYVDEVKSHPVRFLVKQGTAAVLLCLLQRAFAGATGDEDEYDKLSSYTKNNYYNFSLGNGKFIRIPKSHEHAVLDSVFERAVDLVRGKMDKNDWKDLLSYVFDQFLPPGLFVPGIQTDWDEKDMIQKLFSGSIFSGVTDLLANKDFKGSPIVPGNMDNIPAQEQYDENSTAIAKLIGNAIGLSPKRIDHLLDSYTGVIGKVNKALTADRKDYSIGIRNQFVSDAAYSTDILNRFYDDFEISNRKYNSAHATGKDKANYYRYYSMKLEMAQMNRFAYIDGIASARQREIKMMIRDIVDDFSESAPLPYEHELGELLQRTGERISVSSLKPEIKLNGKTKELTFEQYVDYVETYHDELDKAYASILSSSCDDDTKLKQLDKARQNVKDKVNIHYYRMAR